MLCSNATFDPNSWLDSETKSHMTRYRWDEQHAISVITRDLLLNRYDLALTKEQADAVLAIL